MGPVGRVPVAVGRNPALLGWESHRSSQLPQPQQQGCGVGALTSVCCCGSVC